MRVILILLLFTLIAGCSTTKGMQEVIVDNKSKTEYVFPDDKYMTSCEELPTLKGNLPKDLYIWGTDTAVKYDECSYSKDVLSDWIKRFKEDILNK